MANRFTDTTKWNEDWYCELGGEYQLFWDFITDMCDNSGVWKPNKMDFEIKTKFKINLDSFFKKVNGDKQRILLLENGRWFLPGFISYQWFNKKETFDLVLSNRLHKSLYDNLLKNKILMSKVRGLEEVLKASKEMEQVDTTYTSSLEIKKGNGFFLNEISVNLELTKIEINDVIGFIQVVVPDKILAISEVQKHWEAFKIDNFKQREWYGSHEKLISHFRHSLKKQLSNHGNSSKGKAKSASTFLDGVKGDIEEYVRTGTEGD